MSKSFILPMVLGSASLAAGCLEPLVSDERDPAAIFGDPKIAPEAALHVEDDPAFAAQVAQFPGEVAYLGGFADGAAVRYWNVPGPQSALIAPIYLIVDQLGHPVGGRIIDVIPGDPAYTPWWRVVLVKTTSKYAGERIWSRDAIDEGIRLGILEKPVALEDVADCPVVRRDTVIPTGGEPKHPSWGWYRNRRVHWIDFQGSVKLPQSVRRMPAGQVYILQRINQGIPLYEFMAGVDLDGDGDLDDSNNIFSAPLGDPKYSPLWYPVFVRVVSSYVSIDTSTTATVGLSAESQFLDENDAVTSPLVAPNGVLEVPSVLVNCPIQKTRGEL